MADESQNSPPMLARKEVTFKPHGHQEKPMSAWNQWRYNVRLFLDQPDSSRAAKVMKYFMLVLILSAVTMLLLGSLPRYNKKGGDYAKYKDLFEDSEIVFNVIFLIEFVVRCVVGEELLKDAFLLFDFVAVLPFLFQIVLSEEFINTHGGFFTVLKALRVVRLLKIARQYDASIIITRTIRESLAALFVPFFFLNVAVIVFASMVFYIEFEAGGDHARGGIAAFMSIPHAIWFMWVTMTTVGYGDVSPNTGAGKTITAAAMVFGVLFLSMPLAIVGNNFCEIWDDRARVIFLEKFKEVYLRKTGVTREGVKRAFHEIDADKSGTITIGELKVALRKMHVKMSPADVQQLWKVLDWDGSNEISCEEFLDLVAEAEEMEEEDVDVLTEEVERSRRRTFNIQESESTLAVESPTPSASNSSGVDAPAPPPKKMTVAAGHGMAAPAPMMDEGAMLEKMIQAVASLRKNHAEIVEAQRALDIEFASASAGPASAPGAARQNWAHAH